jgi:predicted TPR repeat methyltransferase
MTVQNTLQNQIPYAPAAFDLIVAADVLVYFGSLENLISTFARVSSSGGHLIFSCELATESEAPLGWRLLASGRFAHTKKHATDVASAVGYELAHYEEIVPRMEKGEPVRGHLFGFLLKRNLDKTEL